MDAGLDVKLTQLVASISFPPLRLDQWFRRGTSHETIYQSLAFAKLNLAAQAFANNLVFARPKHEQKHHLTAGGKKKTKNM